jgi:CheY-like chemotaxis protein
MLVRQVLDELGYIAIEAGDATSALKAINSSVEINLVISDIGLPGMNGRQLADMVRKGRPDLPFLFITGYAAMATERNDFLDHGMDMLTKPFAMDDLASKISEMMGS